MPPIGEIACEYGVHLHCYADDNQSHLSVAMDSKDALRHLINFTLIITLKPPPMIINNIDHITTVHCCAGKPWIQAFIGMPL